MSTDLESRQDNDLKRIENRLKTFDNWPLEFIKVDDLAAAGFYYLNNADQVRCVECGGVIGSWEIGDVPLYEHRKFFPNCPIVQEVLNEDIGIQPVCRPKYQEYSTIESRNRSFTGWSLSAIQDPIRLAQAGFYFLGSGDEVRCFYCDGGLRNWLENDDPWIEHARWFPTCQFVQLVKGPSFIKNVLQRTQNTNQTQITPSLPNTPTSIDDAMSTQSAQDALQMGLNAGRVRAVMQRRLQLTGRPFTSTEALVAAVLDGQIEDEGYDHDHGPETESQIENQVTELLLSAVTSVAFSTTEADQQQQQQQQRASTSNELTSLRTVPENSLTRSSAATQPLPSNENSSSTLSTSSKLPRNSTTTSESTAADSDERRLKNVECKICMAEELGVVFLPCGHLLSCVYCAPAVSICPLCREIIRGRVRTFLS